MRVKDAGVVFWQSLLPSPSEARFIPLDDWIHPEKSAVPLETACGEKNPIVLFSTFFDSTKTTKLSHSNQAAHLLLTEYGFRESPKLQYSLRVHALSNEFRHAYVYSYRKSDLLSRQLLISTLAHGAFHFNKSVISKFFRVLRFFRIKRQESNLNSERKQWRLDAERKLKEEFAFVKGNQQHRLTELTLNERKYSFFNPKHVRGIKQVPLSADSAYFSLGQQEEVVFCAQPKDSEKNEATHQSDSAPPGIVLSTLVFNDFMFLPQWIEHYRKYGVNHFLIYFNSWELPEFLVQLGEDNADITVTPWGFEYSHFDSSIGKTNFHVAQPMQLHHSALLAKKMKVGSHLLYVDVDEYIIGNSTLPSLLSKETTEVSFANVWSSCDNMAQPISAETFVQEAIDFSRPDRKKSLRSLNLPGKWNIHGSSDLSTYSKTHIMLHFGDIMRHRKTTGFISKGTAYRNKLKCISTLGSAAQIRKIWDTQL